MPQLTDPYLDKLKKAGTKLGFRKGQAAPYRDVEYELERAAAKTASRWHSLKPIAGITADNLKKSLIMRRALIRGQAVGDMTKRRVARQIMHDAKGVEDFHGTEHNRKLIKKELDILTNFEAEKKPEPSAGVQSNKTLIAARRARLRAIDEETTSPGSAGIADVLRQNQAAQAASHQAISSSADLGGRQRGGFVAQNSTPAANSIGQIISRSKLGPAAGLRPGSRPGGLAPRLVA